VKKAGRGSQCMKVSGNFNYNRGNVSPVQCSPSTAISVCGIGYKCDRRFNICVER
jgi:hypothetical protein